MKLWLPHETGDVCVKKERKQMSVSFSSNQNFCTGHKWNLLSNTKQLLDKPDKTVVRNVTTSENSHLESITGSCCWGFFRQNFTDVGSCWSFSPLCIRETTVYVYCVYQTQTHLGLIWAASKFTAQLWHWQNSQHIWHLAYVRQTCDCRNVGDIDWYSCCISFAPTHWQKRQTGSTSHLKGRTKGW